jgi:glutathione peroxidase-family protein
VEYEQAGEIVALRAEGYVVSFALIERTSVPRPPLAAVERSRAPTRIGPPAWNFTKYLVGSEGRLTARWPTKVPPDDPELVDAIESALPG